MILAVDIGNSNIVIGCFDKNDIMFVERLSTNQLSTALEYTVMIKNILELNGLEPAEIDGGIISSVVPPLTSTLKHAMERLGCGEILTISPGIKTGLKILLDNPAQLGSDRVADAVAAVSCYPVPLILIDMGTATHLFQNHCIIRHLYSVFSHKFGICICNQFCFKYLWCLDCPDIFTFRCCCRICLVVYDFNGIFAWHASYTSTTFAHCIIPSS